MSVAPNPVAAVDAARHRDRMMETARFSAFLGAKGEPGVNRP